MTGPDPTRRLASLLRRLRTRYGEPDAESCPGASCDDTDPLVHELVYSYLLWEAMAGQAKTAFRRLIESVVDYNELRVCLTDELVAMIGERYPLARERCARLRATLNDLYRREHLLTLRHLVEAPKRDAKHYLDTLEGMPAFVSARVTLVCLGGHAMPIDERLRERLVKAGVVEDPTSADSLAGWLERQVRAGEALATYRLLRTWADDDAARPRREPKTGGTRRSGGGDRPAGARKPKAPQS